MYYDTRLLCDCCGALLDFEHILLIEGFENFAFCTEECRDNYENWLGSDKSLEECGCKEEEIIMEHATKHQVDSYDEDILLVTQEQLESALSEIRGGTIDLIVSSQEIIIKGYLDKYKALELEMKRIRQRQIGTVLAYLLLFALVLFAYLTR